jgi:hypothetical protein
MEDQIPNLTPNEFATPDSEKKNKVLPILLVVVVLAAGVVTGYFVSQRKTVTSGGVIPAPEGGSEIAKGSEFGVKDVSAFKDKAMGVLEKGGLDGVGTHKLLREGGPSQTVYLTSSVIDLDQFAGRKVEINGATQKVEKAGWFMDVGRVKVLE